MHNSSNPDLSVIIISFNTKEILRRCLKSLEQEGSSLTKEVIVVDNASKDGSADMVASEFQKVKLIRSPENLGFGRANNKAFDVASGNYYILLNSDAFLKKGALQIAYDHMQRNTKAGLGGAQLLSEDGTWQPSARLFPSIWNEFLIISGLSTKYSKSRLFGAPDRTWDDAQNETATDWVPGAFSIIRPKALQEAGAFDDRFFLYYEEVDLCKRIKAAGYEIWYWPDIQVIHLGGESAKSTKNMVINEGAKQLSIWNMRSAFLYYRKHHGWLGAHGYKWFLQSWLSLRWLKNKVMGRKKSADILAGDLRIVNQAWQETSGGKVAV